MFGITIGTQFRIIANTTTSPTITILYTAIHIGANIVTRAVIHAMAAYTIIQIISLKQIPMNIIIQIGAIAVVNSDELDSLALSLFMGTKGTIGTSDRARGWLV